MGASGGPTSWSLISVFADTFNEVLGEESESLWMSLMAYAIIMLLFYF